MRLALWSRVCLWLAVGVFAVTPTTSWGAKRKTKSDDHKKVELFAAMKTGDIRVTFIPKSAKQGNVIIENKSKQPLAIRLPEAFAGVPIHAQFGGGGGGFGGGGQGGGGFGGGGQGGGGGGQGVGGGFGGGGGGQGGGGFGGGGQGGGGGGFFNVEAEKVRKIKVNTVCLEHGKPDPNPRMKYELRPITTITKDPAVIELCKMVGSGKLNAQSAQAAAWHLANKMSWQELQHKIGIKHLNGTTEPYFQMAELAFGHRVSQEARRRGAIVAQREKQNSQKVLSLSGGE